MVVAVLCWLTVILRFHSAAALPPVFKKEPPRLDLSKIPHGNGNVMTDHILDAIRDFIEYYEPVEITKLGPCETCNLTGITSIKRTGDVISVPLEEDNKRLMIDFGFDLIIANCTCTVNILFLSHTGILTANIWDLHLFADLDVEFDGFESETKVNSAKVTQIQRVDARFWGPGLVGMIGRLGVSILQPLVSSILVSRVQDRIPKLVEKYKDRLGQLGTIST